MISIEEMERLLQLVESEYKKLKDRQNSWLTWLFDDEVYKQAGWHDAINIIVEHYEALQLQLKKYWTQSLLISTDSNEYCASYNIIFNHLSELINGLNDIIQYEDNKIINYILREYAFLLQESNSKLSVNLGANISNYYVINSQKEELAEWMNDNAGLKQKISKINEEILGIEAKVEYTKNVVTACIAFSNCLDYKDDSKSTAILILNFALKEMKQLINNNTCILETDGFGFLEEKEEAEEKVIEFRAKNQNKNISVSTEIPLIEIKKILINMFIYDVSTLFYSSVESLQIKEFKMAYDKLMNDISLYMKLSHLQDNAKKMKINIAFHRLMKQFHNLKSSPYEEYYIKAAFVLYTTQLEAIHMRLFKSFETNRVKHNPELGLLKINNQKTLNMQLQTQLNLLTQRLDKLNSSHSDSLAQFAVLKSITDTLKPKIGVDFYMIKKEVSSYLTQHTLFKFEEKLVANENRSDARNSIANINYKG